MKRLIVCVLFFAGDLYGMHAVKLLRKVRSYEYVRLVDENEQAPKTEKVDITDFTQEDFKKQACLYMRRAALYTLSEKQCTQAEDLADLMSVLCKHLSDETLKGTLNTAEHSLRSMITFTSTIKTAQKN